MTGVLLISQIVLVVIITIAVLLQKSSSIGLGAYSGSNESVFGAKGPGSFLAKMTFFFGFLFIVNTITLGYFYAQESNSSVVDSVIETTDVAAPASAQELPAEPVQAVTTESNTSK
ncbi:preprotein translocase subunit SecG [bacterium]|jgi:preprotein translocase subunit SecG|nr:preprotein translocase subunit SecG [bacterium]